MRAASPVLSVQDLSIRFVSKERTLTAVEGLSFDVAAGETLAIVGESGCGKSITALSLLGLVPKPGLVEARTIALEGRNILEFSEDEMRHVRGNRIAMIFQEPMTALNPVVSIGEQIIEAIREHEIISKKEARNRAVELLRRVRIPDAERRLHEFPHRLSGGMRQRVMIAIALACSPAVLVADEPTTALDVTIQAQILELIDILKKESNTAVVLITHDLGVVAEHADRVLVMYAGRKIEEQPARSLFQEQLHPYTRGLLAARPRLSTLATRERLVEIPGSVPSLAEMPVGCRFAPRCGFGVPACTAADPALVQAGAGAVACIRWRELSVAE